MKGKVLKNEVDYSPIIDWVRTLLIERVALRLIRHLHSKL